MKIFKVGFMMHDFVAEVLRSEKTPEVRLLESETPFRLDIGDFIVSGRVDDILLLEVENKKLLDKLTSARYRERDYPPPIRLGGLLRAESVYARKLRLSGLVLTALLAVTPARGAITDVQR